MTVASTISIFTIASLLTAAGIWLFLRLQPSLGLLDVPNDRSLHSHPIPRGGGVVVVIVWFSLYLTYTAAVGDAPNLPFLVAAFSIAAVSFIDDLWSIPLLPRLLLHIASAAFIVWETGGYSGLIVPFADVSLSLNGIGPYFSVIFIVWMINAYNFMDGVDGILGMQGITAGVAWAVAGFLFGSAIASIAGAAIAGCCLGFLFFNWQPARIFMGDVGSTFIGFVIACVPLLIKDSFELQNSGLTLSIFFSLLFLFDTVYTRIALILGKAKFWLPHREHLYQKLVRAGEPHRTVALYFGLAGLGISLASLLWFHIRGNSAAAPTATALAACILLFIWSRKKILT